MCVKKKHSYINYVDDLPFLRLSLLSVFAPAFLGTDSTSFSKKKKEKDLKWSHMYKVCKSTSCILIRKDLLIHC